MLEVPDFPSLLVFYPQTSLSLPGLLPSGGRL
jgi:hypothetical protein